MNLGPIIANLPPVENLQKRLKTRTDDKSANIFSARRFTGASRMAGLARNEGAPWRKNERTFENVDFCWHRLVRPLCRTYQDKPFNAREITVNGMQRPYSDNVVWAGLASL